MFEEVKKKLGFGFMRLPMTGGAVDEAETCRMVDAFLAAGFNYFDTAHGYIDGKSEQAIRTCLTSRYPRDRYVLANKLSHDFFETQADIRKVFDVQLQACGVEYFDFYLMHAQNKAFFEKYKRCRAYETALELKEEGKIRHLALSFHDSADVLDRILTEYPQVEAVQIQFNYLDYDDNGVQSRLCYEVCRNHNKPVIVMEPVRGGRLVNLPAAADQVFRRLNGGSNASYAIRFAADFEGVFMVLSGMSNLEQMRDNLSYMTDYRHLTEAEKAAVWQAADAIRAQDSIACTGCRYCVAGCPANIAIPDLFGDVNTLDRFKDWDGDWAYGVHTKGRGKASDCIRCGKCEAACPQKLPIRDLLVKVAEIFEK